MSFIFALAAVILWMAGCGIHANRDNELLGDGLTFGAILVAYLAGISA